MSGDKMHPSTFAPLIIHPPETIEFKIISVRSFGKSLVKTVFGSCQEYTWHPGLTRDHETRVPLQSSLQPEFALPWWKYGHYSNDTDRSQSTEGPTADESPFCLQGVYESPQGEHPFSWLLLWLKDFPHLELSDKIEEITQLYMDRLDIPEKSFRDAAHLAVASVHNIDYLVTWNCAHLANGEISKKLTVKGLVVSKIAKEKIEKAGGKVS